MKRPAWIDSEEFESLLYSYRSAPTIDQAWVCRSFEAILAYIAQHVEPASADKTVEAGGFVFKRPIRSVRMAMRYWLPRRLTLPCNPRVHAWLWWNF